MLQGACTLKDIIVWSLSISLDNRTCTKVSDCAVPSINTTPPHMQAELERSPVRGQEQEQPDVSPLPLPYNFILSSIPDE